MPTSLFITGSTGFIGRHLLRSLGANGYQNLYCLTRQASPETTDVAGGTIHFIRGDLGDASAYEAYLRRSDVVIHLAAVTGKANPDDYFHVNTQGTQGLVEQCQRLGVSKFLYVSSIAVKFADKSHYPYAQSKQQAEAIVRSSGLHYTIIRPTIVLGQESGIWQSLSRLSRAPIIPLFGSGCARIQPIYIQDLIDCMRFILEKTMFSQQTFELGGPETLTMEDFLRRIHYHYYRRDPKVIHLPINYTKIMINFFEQYFLRFLPFTSGQLASFTNDGTIENNDLFQYFSSSMKNVNAMLSLLITNDE